MTERRVTYPPHDEPVTDCEKAYYGWMDSMRPDELETCEDPWLAFKAGWEARIVDVGLVTKNFETGEITKQHEPQ